MAKKVTIKATVPKNEKEGVKEDITATLTVDYAENVAEAVKLYGEEAILSNAFANWRVTLQSNVRAGLKKGETPAQIQTRLGGAKMGVAALGPAVDPVAAYVAAFHSATPERQKQMLAELQSKVSK